MKFIAEYWFLIVAMLAMVAVGGCTVYAFLKMPSEEQLEKIREWLLYAVTMAEKKLGGGTGKLKLRYVYDMFVVKFPWLVKVIPFETFSLMVDEALEEMRMMLKENRAVQELVTGNETGLEENTEECI